MDFENDYTTISRPKETKKAMFSQKRFPKVCTAWRHLSAVEEVDEYSVDILRVERDLFKYQIYVTS